MSVNRGVEKATSTDSYASPFCAKVGGREVFSFNKPIAVYDTKTVQDGGSDIECDLVTDDKVEDWLSTPVAHGPFIKLMLVRLTRTLCRIMVLLTSGLV